MEELEQEKRKSPVRRTRKQIIKLLKEFEGTEGLTVIDFCKQHDVNKSNFYNWQKRYGSKQSPLSKPKGFVAVEVTSPIASAPSLFAEVKGIRLYQMVTAEYLKTLAS